MTDLPTPDLPTPDDLELPTADTSELLDDTSRKKPGWPKGKPRGPRSASPLSEDADKPSAKVADFSKPRLVADNKSLKYSHSVDVLAKRIQSAHGLITLLTGSDAFEITLEESKELVDALFTCGKEYGVKIDPKIAAVLGVFTAIGGIYGPRTAAFLIDRKLAPRRAPNLSGT